MFTVPALVSTLVSTHVGATSRVHYPRQNVARVGAKSRVPHRLRSSGCGVCGVGSHVRKLLFILEGRFAVFDVCVHFTDVTFMFDVN